MRSVTLRGVTVIVGEVTAKKPDIEGADKM